jgi:hypothetical protein
MVISDGIPVVTQNRKSRNPIPNPSTKRKQFGVLFRETIIEANSCYSVLNPSADRTQIGIPFRGTKIDANSRNSVPNHFAEENTTQNSFHCNKK